MNEDIREVGGNKLALRWGKYLLKVGRKYVDKGSKTIISNPACTFINPFTMLLTFTVNNTDKYQLVKQGKYKEKYKMQSESETDECPLSKEEMFMVILSDKGSWFKKEL